MDMRSAIGRVIAGDDLDESEMEAVMGCIMRGEATPAQIAGFLVGLRMKGERVGEITGAARAMRRCATAVEIGPDLVDTCGTGGDGSGSFNISTAAALIAAAAGVTVAKHGNRAISGSVGGADVLEALGVRIDLPPDRVAACVRRVGIGFFFAPVFHPAMRHAAVPRRELGVRTIFNLLGPLSNPAGARVQLLGVFAADWVEPLAQALARLGSRRVLVVHGEDGLDEISLSAPTQMAELADGHVCRSCLDPADLGLERCAAEELRGGDIERNAAILRAVLAGQGTRAQNDVAMLNAAAVLYVAGHAADFSDGLERARATVRDGRATAKLAALVEQSHA